MFKHSFNSYSKFKPRNNFEYSSYYLCLFLFSLKKKINEHSKIPQDADWVQEVRRLTPNDSKGKQ